jgi:uncharacterized protein
MSELPAYSSPDTSPVVLITGASSGLGWHLAATWAKHGARIVLVARDPVKLQQAAEQLALDSTRLLVVPCDVTVSEQVQRLFAQVREQWGRLDVLVNCAGVSMRGTIAETPLSEFNRLWQINVLAVVDCIQQALPLLRESRGSIVNIGSLGSKAASKYYGAYPATKFAVAALCQQLRLELKSEGVHVLLVCPGPIQRADAGTRYAAQAANLPAAAQAPGGGVQLRGLEPGYLSERIIRAVAKRQIELVIPWKARILFTIAQLFPTWGDWLLSKFVKNDRQ